MDIDLKMGHEKIPKLVLGVAIPSMLAQFVSVLYSIVDRMYVGNIEGVGNLALAGVGICGPIVTMIGAFGFWVGFGGAPLVGISLGAKEKERASRILSNCLILTLFLSLFATAVSMALQKPMLYLFGASDTTFPFAKDYFTVYVSGTVFALLSTGMNQFIIVQGHAKAGMVSVIIGALLNIGLDPLFIFALRMGVKGAALATIISQAASAAFVLTFLFKKASLKLTWQKPDLTPMLQVLKLGFSPFAIIALDNVMILTMNALLQRHGGADGDMLVTCNAIAQSFMLVLTMPLGGISSGTQGVISYNYGAGRAERVRKAQYFIMTLCVIYTTCLFLFARVAGNAFTALFTSDETVRNEAARAIRICTLAAIPLGAQYPSVDGFTAMGEVASALFLSFFRKLVFFVSIFLLPLFFEAYSIFFAETLSDIFGPMLSVPFYLIYSKKILKRRAAMMQPSHI